VTTHRARPGRSPPQRSASAHGLPRGGAPCDVRKPGSKNAPGTRTGGSGSSSRAKRSPARATDGQQSLVACGGDRGIASRGGLRTRFSPSVRRFDLGLQVRNLAQLDTATDCSTTGECLVCAVTTWATAIWPTCSQQHSSHGVERETETPPDGRFPARWLTSAISIGKLAVPLIVTATWSVGAAEHTAAERPDPGSRKWAQLGRRQAAKDESRRAIRAGP